MALIKNDVGGVVDNDAGNISSAQQRSESKLKPRLERETEFNNTQFVQVRYTDIPGRFLAKYFCSNNDSSEERKLFELLKNGVGVDGSSVRGFANIDESDLLLIPDRATLRQSPISSRFKVATVIADVYNGFGKGRLIRDPRYVAQLVEEELLISEGLSCQVGPEVECFIFDNILFKAECKMGTAQIGDDEPEIVSLEQEGQSKYHIRRKGGYDAPPFQDSMYEMRFEIADVLKRFFFIDVTNLNHEVASSGQIEINFKHSGLTRAADNVQIYKDVVRDVAKKHNKVANFMPKPIFDGSNPRSGDNGSGMHTSISLWTKGPALYPYSSSNSNGNRSSATTANNIFYDENDTYAEISQKGRYFIGGIMEHASSLTAFVAPTKNSYHRMVPGFEAPVYVAWSRANRSAVLRVPTNDRNNAAAKRIEFRAPDPSANPYLAFSAIVLAGLDGIKKRLDPGDSTDRDIYKMSDRERADHGIKSLPGSLADSLDALKSDSGYLKPCFPDELVEVYTSIKRQEIKDVGPTKKQEFLYYHDI